MPSMATDAPINAPQKTAGHAPKKAEAALKFLAAATANSKMANNATTATTTTTTAVPTPAPSNPDGDVPSSDSHAPKKTAATKLSRTTNNATTPIRPITAKDTAHQTADGHTSAATASATKSISSTANNAIPVKPTHPTITTVAAPPASASIIAATAKFLPLSKTVTMETTFPETVVPIHASRKTISPANQSTANPSVSRFSAETAN